MMQKRSAQSTRIKVAESIESETSKVDVVSAQACVCRLCLEAIEEPCDSNDGQDAARSIHCDGECQGWLHRRCAGLSLIAFSAAVNSPTSDEFFCTHCQVKKASPRNQ